VGSSSTAAAATERECHCLCTWSTSRRDANAERKKADIMVNGAEKNSVDGGD